jgi:hypothetical protein
VNRNLDSAAATPAASTSVPRTSSITRHRSGAASRPEVMYARLETDTAFRHPEFYSGGVKWEAVPSKIASATSSHRTSSACPRTCPPRAPTSAATPAHLPTGTMRNSGDADARSKDEAAESWSSGSGASTSSSST